MEERLELIPKMKENRQCAPSLCLFDLGTEVVAMSKAANPGGSLNNDRCLREGVVVPPVTGHCQLLFQSFAFTGLHKILIEPRTPRALLKKR